MIVRELIHVIGFRINESQLATVEQRIGSLGRMMSFATTLPIILMGKSFVEAATKVEMLELNIKAYSSSAEEAAKVTRELKQLATELPTIKVEELGEVAGKMLGRGIKPEELVGTLRTLSTVAAATGSNLSLLAKAYTDVRAKTKLSGQEVNQFANNNVALYNAMSEMTGKSIDALKQEQKQGKISFEQVKKTLEWMGGPGSKFAEVMAQKSETLWGRWQKFLDKFFLFVQAELGKKLMVPLGIVLDLMDKLMDSFSKLDGNWKRFFVIGMAVTAIIGPLMALYHIFKMMSRPLMIVALAITALSLAIDDIYVWVKGGKSVMGAIFGDYEKNKPAIDAIKQVAKDILDLAATIAKQPLDLIKWLVGGTDISPLNMLVGVIGGLAKTIHIILFDVTAMIRMINALAHGDLTKAAAIGEAFNKENYDILVDPFNPLTKNPNKPSVAKTPRNDWGEFFKSQFGTGFTGDAFNSLKRTISERLDLGATVDRLAKNDFVTRIPYDPNAKTVNMPVTVNVDAKGAGVDADRIRPQFERMVTDTLAKALKKNLPGPRKPDGN